jgi:hypothetical protein
LSASVFSVRLILLFSGALDVLFLLAGENTDILFLMLTRQDVNDMRGGRTKFVDGKVLKNNKFEKVVVSLHENQTEIEEMIRQAGHGKLLPGMESPVAEKTQAVSQGCAGITEAYLLLESRCVACWRETARAMGS